MRNKQNEIFDLFRKSRRKTLTDRVEQTGHAHRPDTETENASASGDSPRILYFRRDTIIVIGMLAAVSVAAAFFLGVMVGRSNPPAADKTAKKAAKNRLFSPLPSEERAGRDEHVSPAAHIQGPVGERVAVTKKFVIRVASYLRSQTGKGLAKKNAAILKERGFPAGCRERGRYVTIEVGEFTSASDPAAGRMLAKLREFQLRGARQFKDALIVSVSR